VQLDIFITCEELVDVINVLVKKTGCSVFLSFERERSYKSFSVITMDDILKCRNMELGMLSDAKKLLTQPEKNIYREDRVGFVSVHPDCKYEFPKFPNVLLATDFISDASDTAKIIFKTLRKILLGFARKGVKVINENTNAIGISKTIYWTDKALATNKVWKNAEASCVRFEPL